MFACWLCSCSCSCPRTSYPIHAPTTPTTPVSTLISCKVILASINKEEEEEEVVVFTRDNRRRSFVHFAMTTASTFVKVQTKWHAVASGFPVVLGCLHILRIVFRARTGRSKFLCVYLLAASKYLGTSEGESQRLRRAPYFPRPQ